MNTTIKIALASDSVQGRSGAINHIYPAPNEVSLTDRLFIVSAGMGDTEHANHFAEIICQTFQQKISRATGLNTQRLGQVFVNDTLRQAEREIQKYLIQYPRLKDVLGVMALAYFNTDGSIALAWVGNCRAYHIRNGKVLYQTEDHLANLMQDNKVVVIPRAINGIEPAWASLSTITNVQPNDILLLCTPSVIEAVGEIQLMQICSPTANAQTIFQAIGDKITTPTDAVNSKSDGLFVIQIEDSVLSGSQSNLQQGNRNLSSYADLLSAEKQDRGIGVKRNLVLQIGVVATVLLILAAISFLIYRHYQNQPERTVNQLLTEAQALAVEGNYEKAIRDLETALAIETTDTELHSTAQFLLQKIRQGMVLTHADSLLEAGELFEAKVNYDNAYSIDTDNQEVRNRVAVVGKMLDEEKRIRLVKADSLLGVKDFANARYQLYGALMFDQNNKRILEKINQCNVKLKEDTISLANALTKASDYIHAQKDTLK